MTPLSYLTGYGAKAYPVTALTWGLLIISIVVVIIVTGLVLAGVITRRARPEMPLSEVPVERRGSGLGMLGWASASLLSCS